MRNTFKQHFTSFQKVPDSLKTMIEGLRKMEEEGDDEIDLARPRSGGREPREEFPRPLSQVKPFLKMHLSLFILGSTYFCRLDWLLPSRRV